MIDNHVYQMQNASYWKYICDRKMDMQHSEQIVLKSNNDFKVTIPGDYM